MGDPPTVRLLARHRMRTDGHVGVDEDAAGAERPVNACIEPAFAGHGFTRGAGPGTWPRNTPRERRLERPTGGPALQGWRTPVRVPATGATRGDVGDCVGQGRGCGCGGGMARRVPGCGRGVGLGGSVLPRDPRRGILGGTLGGRCPATAAPRPVAVIRCREARSNQTA